MNGGQYDLCLVGLVRREGRRWLVPPGRLYGERSSILCQGEVAPHNILYVQAVVTNFI